MTPQSDEGAKTVAAIHRQLLNIGAKLESGRRVYFKRLGRILHTIAVSTNTMPFLHNADEKTLAKTAENVGRDALFERR